MDKRVFKTQKLIKDTFIELLGQYNFDKITIKMICDQANIGRKTFYLHFKDKYQLLDTIISEMNILFRNQIKNKLSKSKESKRQFYLSAFNFYDKNKILLKNIYHSQGMVIIRQNVQNIIMKRLVNKYNYNNQTVILFISAGITRIFEAYINNELSENKDEIIDDIISLFQQINKLFIKE